MLPSGPVTPFPTSPTSLISPPPHLTPSQLLTPTSTLYASPSPTPKHYGKYRDERAKLDWGYHTIPTEERQALQDEIVDAVLERVSMECEEWESRKGKGKGRVSSEQEEDPGDLTRNGCGVDGIGKEGRPLALFTAGGMGAGKGHTLRNFLRTGVVRLPKNFVWVDPDSLARSLPEREQYLQANPKTASTLLHPEASLLQEILSGVGRSMGRSLVIDGSMSDCSWFKGVLRKYDEEGYDAQILFVFASEEIMLSRAERRATNTGRVTDPEKIKASRIKSPECVGRLAKPGLVRRTRIVDNTNDHTPPKIVYDSARDPEWLRRVKLIDARTEDWKLESFILDVKGFVEGRLKQDEEGRVVEVGVGGGNEVQGVNGGEGEMRRGRKSSL